MDGAGPTNILAGGQRRLLTVLFADIVGSSAIVADQDPETADERLMQRLQAMIDAVHRFDGTVTQILGDGIVAMFGAPRAQEHHALRACLAAAAIHDVGAADAANGGSPRARVGLDSGEVVASLVRNDISHEFRAAGETVYLAARMQGLAAPGSTLLTERTRHLVASQIRVGPWAPAPFALSAASSAVRYCRLLAVESSQQPFRQLRRRHLGSLIGRERELMLLHHAAADTRRSDGRFVIVRGDAGIGKTRLVFEFLERVRAADWGVVECNFRPTGLARPLEAMACVARHLLQMPEERPAPTGETLIRARLTRLGIVDTDRVAALLALLGERWAADASRQFEPSERLHGMVDAVIGLVLAASGERSQIIVLEDVHWADSAARAFLEALVGRVAGTRVLVLATQRDHHAALLRASGRHVLDCALRQFSDADCEQYLTEVLGADPALCALKQLLTRQGQGNPFFLEECVRVLRDTGVVAGPPGAHTLTESVVELKVPDSVHAVIAARIDLLPTPDRLLLLHAAILGLSFDVNVLRDLAGVMRNQLFLQLEQLHLAGFLQRTRLMPNMEYSFRHALIHEVAYNTVLRRQRIALHRRALAAIRRRPRDRIQGRTELLAHHAHAADAAPAAFVYGRAAGLEAQDKSKNQEAQAYLTNALAGLGKCPDTLRNRRAAVDLRLDLARSLYALGEHEVAHVHLQGARGRAVALGDQGRLGKVLSSTTLHYWIRGRLTQAIDSERAAISMARIHSDRVQEMSSKARLGLIMTDRGEYRAAIRLLTDASTFLTDDGLQQRYGQLGSVSTGVFASLAVCYAELGRFRDAMRVGDRATELAESHGHGFSRVYANLHVGTALLRQGEFQRAVPLLERGLSFCRDIGSNLLGPWCTSALGYAYFRTGDHENGLSLLEETVTQDARHAVGRALGFAWLAEARLEVGDIDLALRHAEHAQKLSTANEEAALQAWAAWVFGEASSLAVGAARRGAASHLERARELARDAGMRPLLAHCQASLARLHEPDTVQGSPEDAGRFFEELGMNYWAARTRRQMRRPAGEDLSPMPTPVTPLDVAS